MINYLKRAKYALLFTLLLCSSGAFAQVNDYKFGLGAGIGLNTAFVDVREHKWSKSYYVKWFYYFDPYITGEVEVQGGNIRGGSVVTNTHLREFNNRYTQVTANARVFAGKFINNYGNLAFLIRGFNLGLGAGFIKNKMIYIVRVKPDGSNYVFPGKDQSTNFVIPINLGYDIHLYSIEHNDRFIVSLNLQHNITFDEGLDGYNDPTQKFSNNFPDMYLIASVGAKFSFGGTGAVSRRR